MKFGPLFIGLILTISSVRPFIPLSPCPDFFRYYQLNVSDVYVWVASLSIPPPRFLLPIKLDVFLYLEAVLPTKYVGILELNEPRDVVLARLTRQIWKPISYIIRFPLQSPLPTVKNISANNNSLCVGPPVLAPIITTIHLEHTLFPRHSYNKVINRTGTGSDDVNNPTHPSSVIKEWGDSSSIFKRDDFGLCGQPVLVNPLIAGGKVIRYGEWPWLVAVFVSQSLGLQFHCSATLISDEFVVTAGHCMNHEDTGLLTTDSVLLYMGKFNLKNWTEPNSVLRQALEIYIHPDYNSHNFSSDLALVKFKPIKFTAYINPACLWSGSSNLDPYVGKTGMVVGWGRSNGEAELKNEPYKVQLRIVSQEKCLRSHADFVYLTSEKTLCAGDKNGAGPCNGDSGAGLLLLRENSNIWDLRGIVSLSLLNATTQSVKCNLHEYTVFTDIAKFHDWIQGYIT